MAHTFDTSARSAHATTPNPRVLPYTCGAGTTVLILAIAHTGAGTNRAGGAPTYNGVQMLQAGTVQKAATSPEGEFELWYTINPPTGASYDISVPNTGGQGMVLEAASFKAAAGYKSTFCASGVNNATSLNPSVSVTTVANNCMVFAGLFSGAQSWNGTGARTIGGVNAVKLYDTDNGSQGNSSMYLLDVGNAGAKACSFTFGTSEDYGAVAVSFMEEVNGVAVTPSAATSAATTVAPTVTPTLTYFGGVSSSSTGDPFGTSAAAISGYTAEVGADGTYTVCPGTGPQRLCSLAQYVDVTSGSADFRAAIYGPVDGVHDNELVAQGASAITVSSTTLVWAEHSSFVDSSGAPIDNPILEGGSRYRLVMTANGTTGYVGYGTGNNVYRVSIANYTAGYPATLAAPTYQVTNLSDVRAAVIAGPLVPLVVSPAAATAAAVSVDPTIPGPVTLTPAAATGAAATVNPTVIDGSVAATWSQIYKGWNQAGSTTGITVNLGNTPIAGDLVVVSVCCYDGVATNVTISGLDGPLTMLGPAKAGSGTLQIWTGYGVASGSGGQSFTATITGGSAYIDIFGASFRLSSGTPTYDTSAICTTTNVADGSGNLTTPSITPASAGCLLWAAAFPSDVVTAPTAGNTLNGWTGSNNDVNSGASAYKLNSASGSNPIAFTIGSADNPSAAMVVSFKGSGGTPAPLVVSPAAATAAATTVDPTIPTSGESITVSPAAATAVAVTVTPSVIPNLYFTTFPTTETLLSEGGLWSNGQTHGLDWNGPTVTGGNALSHQVSGNGFNDTIACLNQDFNANQVVEATVFADGTSGTHEVELLLRFSITANDAHGYEVLYSIDTSNPYLQLVRWNGTRDSFTYLERKNNPAGVPQTGDVLKAQIIGNQVTAWQNGSLVLSHDVSKAEDDTSAAGTIWSTGHPGMGFYIGGGHSENFGFSDWKAYDVTSIVFAPSASTSIATTVAPTTRLGSIVLSVNPATATAVTVAPTVLYTSITMSPTYAASVSTVVLPVTILGNIIRGPPASTAAAVTIDPTVKLGSISLSPTFASAAAVSVAPSILGSDLTLTPAFCAAASATMTVTVVLGSITLTPSASLAAAATVAPFVSGVFPAPSTSAAATVNPTVKLGSVSLAPAAATAVAATVAPSIGGGGLIVAPTAASAASVTVAPAIGLSSFAVSPAFASAVSATVAPSILAGSIVLTPASASTAAAAADPQLGFGGVIAAPVASTSAAVTVAPTVTLGSMVVAPSVLTGGASTLGPTVKLGSHTVTPAVAIMVAATLGPTLLVGGLMVAPAAATAATATSAPSVIKSSHTATTAPATAGAVSTSPTVILNSTSTAPQPATATATTIAPTTLHASLVLSPVAATGKAASVNPSVVFGSAVSQPLAVEARTETSCTVFLSSVSYAPDAATAKTESLVEVAVRNFAYDIVVQSVSSIPINCTVSTKTLTLQGVSIILPIVVGAVKAGPSIVVGTVMSEV